MTTSPLRRLTWLLLFAGAAACGRCDAEEAPELDRPESPATGEAAVDEAPDEADDTPEAPARPVIVHEEPPTEADLAVAPITGDWTTYRGAGHRSGLRDVPSIRDPRIIWSANVGIQGYANNPVVTEDAVYVASQGERHNRDDETDGVVALHPNTGAVLWRATTERDANGLVLAGDLLVTGTDGYMLHAFRRSDGTEAWQLEVQCPVYQAPVYADGVLYILREEGVDRIDAATGTPLGGELTECRRSERGALSFDGDRLYISPTNSGVEGWEREGSGDWFQAYAAESATDERDGRGRWAPPLVTESLVIEAVHRWPFGTADSLSLRPAIAVRWADNGQLVTLIDVNDPAHAEPAPGEHGTAFLRSLPLLVGRNLFWTPTHDNTLVRWDALTGERTGALEFPDCRVRQFAGLVSNGEVAYLPRHDGMLYAIGLEPMEILWSQNIGLHGVVGTSRSHHPIPGGCTEEPDDGTALFATPALGPDGTLYVGSGDGWLYAIRDTSW